jgi:tetratricopeptide (TPR) repeat protein
MSVRFCAHCGTGTVPRAKFCIECGAPIGGAPPSARKGWQLSATGSAVLGSFLIAGLAIWTAILSPTPPRPGPGATAARPAAGAPKVAADAPEGHPKVEMPAEVKVFIADLEAKAKEKPGEVEPWLRLAQVNLRAAQIDPSYSTPALAAYRHVLEIEPDNPDGLRGVANVLYDRNESREAISYYERYLAARPDDESARTDLGTMYLSAGDPARAVATYKDVIRRNPSFLQAHYNLGVSYARAGDTDAALAELQTARGLATDDDVRRQIDEMIAHLKGQGAPPSGDGSPGARPQTGGDRSPFQGAVEEAFRGHPIMGPRIVRFEWSGPGTGRVLVQDFPMEGMPPEVRSKFAGRLGDSLRTARTAHPVDDPVRVEIADVATGRVMETVTP